MARRKRRVCATDKRPYKWLRAEPCIQYAEPLPEDRTPIRSSKGVVDLLRDEYDFGSRGVESFWVIGTDTKLRPVMVSELTRGGRDQSVVDVSVLFQTLLLAGTPRFIIAHNHPSGDPRPSEEDIALTERVRKGAREVGVRLLDHVIIAYPDRHFSFLDAGLMGGA